MDNVRNIVDFLNGVAADDDAADDDAAAGANLNYPSQPSTPDIVWTLHHCLFWNWNVYVRFQIQWIQKSCPLRK